MSYPPQTQSQTPPKVKPAGVWYVVPAVLLGLSFVIFFTWFVRLVMDVDDSMTTLGSDRSVTLTGEPLVVYVDGVPTSGVSCTAEGSSGVIRLAPPTSDKMDAPEAGWTPVALLPDNLPEGSYTLACDGAKTSTMAVSTDVLAKVTDGVLWGFGLPTLLGLAAIGLFIFLPVKRASSKRAIENQRLQAWYSYQYWSNQPGGQQPPSQTPQQDPYGRPPYGS